MKDIYVNSRLHSLLLRCGVLWPRRTWIFSQGEPWLFLSPKRLHKLAMHLGRDDKRVTRLLRLVRRYVPESEDYLRLLGLPRVYDETEGFCAECGALLPDAAALAPADSLCPSCLQDREYGEGAFTPVQLEDQAADRTKRDWILKHDPAALDPRQLAPLPRRRVVTRDWREAARLIGKGMTYRQVSSRLDSTLSLVHRRVKECYWEDN